MFYTFDNGGIKTGDQMISELDYDAYYRPSATFPGCLFIWAFDPCYGTLAAFRAAKNKETHGLGFDGGPNPFFVNEAAGDYRLTQSGPAKGVGTPLPANVAADIGVQAGLPVDLGALNWPGRPVLQKPNAPSGL